MEIEWKLKAKMPDGVEVYTTDDDAGTFPRGTMFTRVRITRGQPETEEQRKTGYLEQRKKKREF